MTQDCLNSPSTADVSKHLPKGIHVTGADDKSDPAIEGMPWSHLLISSLTAMISVWMMRRRRYIPEIYLEGINKQWA